MRTQDRKITIILKIDPHLKDLNPKDLAMLVVILDPRLDPGLDPNPDLDLDPNQDPLCQDVPGLPHVIAQDLDRGQDQRLR